ncbi:3-hydroxyacyl-CoA dehydrogenase NAD-binding domain-containing protein [Rhodoplanes sp. TEM]|uniref:3-hydroxyacyl-CoA dehydrogenase NAD-binding domain-containing protein n=1 Tax=Rhodoplanes tepidamans TaxID=200616 RepID=A0ABT5J3H3_RHOTP|nr:MULTISPECIES: 3-hydroxyacyl-CoA dehydrogenase [Rhodoplanes]MDC7784214.1 3-hydroxyacyl-CoA dehydrogenase NAD-binding domain-containing protein [Rhodoplanes tepidamans]MDC7987354.1 3-hydroxyacyl-CoA dehydrogenase NAD-binding domain-containing protein [Rhodoplanes sp. TEM]MDQ0356688.1 3-hydroxyacyl-CoA dehydrogenase [Rhodoplanes tepidamans]
MSQDIRPADIKSVAVIGGGTMGSGIAAACAAAGRDVLLLEANEALAEKAKARVESLAADDAETALFRDKVAVGTLATDGARLAAADWICEAVIETLDAKKAVLAAIEPLRRDGSIVTTNTSGIPLSAIVAGEPERLKRDMLVTHFFNPVRVMRLLEIVTGPDTRADARETLGGFLRDVLKKGLVSAKDTPNFIGNRIGLYFILSGLHLGAQHRARGMRIDRIDALLGAPVGFPGTALYGLVDLIGLDVVSSIAKNLAETLPEGDAGRAFASLPAAEAAMLARGQLGRKSGGGFYRMQKAADGSKLKEVFDPEAAGGAGSWGPSSKIELDGDSAALETLFFAETADGALVRDVLGGTLLYAADLVPEISDDIVNVDRAMRWGFNWAKGPFELLDRIGPQRVIDRLAGEGRPLPRMLAVLQKAGTARFYDGATCLGTDGRMHPMPAE